MKFDLTVDPIEHFLKIFAEASQVVTKDVNAMMLATVEENKPSVRTVFYKGMIRGGFSFYTNYEGRKGRELIKNPHAAAVFYWSATDIQIRIEGNVEKLTRSESEAYFATRPHLSQIGAWASHQSENLSSYAELEKRTEEFEQKFKNQKVPCPPHWGGFHILPLNIEFWFGKTGRLHERYVYSRRSLNDSWKTSMKYP